MGVRPPKVPADELLARIRAAVEAGDVRFSGHANERLQQREVTVQEVHQVLRRGRSEPAKDAYSTKHGRWNYAVRGKTIDGRELRVAIDVDDGVFVVTVIDLQAKD